MTPLRQRLGWKIISIVAIIATMLGGAFLGYKSASPATSLSADANDALSAHNAESSDESHQTKSPSLTRSVATSSSATNEERSLADILRSGDSAALDRLLPQGIRDIEGMGGKGLARQVKSHGMWFPVFDLSQANKANGDTTPEDEIDPEKVKVAKVPLSIIAPPPSAGLVGQVISQAFSAVGGTPPYQWSMQSSGEASAFVIDPNTGLLSGTTTKPTNASFTITVHDTAKEVASISAALTVTPAEKLTITTTGLPDAVVNQVLSATLSASGGVPPYTWTLTNPPSGWSCDPSGTITAMPTEPHDFEFEVIVTDSQGTTEQGNVRVSVTEGIKITTESPLMPAAPGEDYFFTFDAEGGTAPYHWLLSSGALPAGWQLSQEGVLRGRASTQEQRFRFTIEARDANNVRQTKDFDLALRRLLIAVPSRERVGLAWQPQEVARAAEAALAGVSVKRNNLEIYRGSGTNMVDYGLTPLTTYRYTLTAHTLDGRAIPIASTQVNVVPISLQRGTTGSRGDPFADRVTSFQPLTPGGYGAALLPRNVTGPPDGRDTFTPAWQASDVLSLHASPVAGGSIMLEFTDNIISDESGPDFTVFENVMFVGRDPANRYMEPAVVEVALFEGQWHRFPTRVSPPADGKPNLRQPSYYAAGFAGVNATTGDDPTDPSRSGGDSFDLASLGVPDLHWIRYIRLRATGDGVLMDASGFRIRHTGENNALSGKDASGFDLDAVSAVHY